MSGKGDKNILGKGAFEEKLEAKSDSFHVTTPPRKNSPSTQSSPTSGANQQKDEMLHGLFQKTEFHRELFFNLTGVS